MAVIEMYKKENVMEKRVKSNKLPISGDFFLTVEVRITIYKE